LGGIPTAFHATNFVIFECSILLFQFLLEGLGVSRGRALLASWLWCFLPQHLEPVSWASSRKDLLAIFFILAAANAFFLAGEKPKKWYFFALPLFLFNIFSKPVYLFLPILGVIYFWSEREKRRFFLICSFCGIGCALFFRWFLSVINPTDIQIDFFERLTLVATAIGREILGWFIASLNILEFDGFQAQGALFPLVTITAAIAMIVCLVYGIRSRRKAYWAVPLGLSLLLLTVPNVATLHRFYYSGRYLEPVCLFLFLSLAILIPRRFSLFLSLLLLAVLTETYVDGKNWESPLATSGKAYRSRPESIGTATRYYVDLRNMERADKLTPEEQAELKAVGGQLTRECTPVSTLRDRLISCEMYYEVMFGIAKNDKNEAEVVRWGDALRISSKIFPGLSERIATEWAFREGDRAVAERWDRHWLATPRLRILQWSATCLRGEDTRKLEYFSKRLLTPKLIRYFYQFDGNVHPSLRPELKACLARDLASHQ
ncbi:MAG: hypothetical protein ACXVBE_11495, partial [Bdellovibrionota bacterium]